MIGADKDFYIDESCNHMREGKIIYISKSGESYCSIVFNRDIAEWDNYYGEQWHIYGHIHNNRNEAYEIMRLKERALNAAVCINNYTPVSFRELVENNKKYKRDGNI